MNLLWKSTSIVSVIITFSRTLNFIIILTKHEFKALKKVIMPETFNVDFHNKLIKFELFCFLTNESMDSYR